MSTNMEIDPELAQRLHVLREQPARDPAKAAQGRAAFLEEAEAVNSVLPLPVTKEAQQRHIRWMHPLQQLFRLDRKERSPMFGALGTILLIVSLVLGGSGITVAAAQNSLPDQMLYPVKTWSEDVRTGMAGNTQTRLELALEYTSRRAEEMQALLKAGQTPPEAVLTRMQAEIDQAMQWAVGQPDGEAVKALEQIRERLQAHEQLLLGLEKPVDPQAGAVLDRTRTLLQDRLHLCEVGLRDPAMLRQQLRNRDQQQDGGITPSVPAMTPAATRLSSPQTAAPAWQARTPTPGSGYGPGPQNAAGNAAGAVNTADAGTVSGSGGHNPWTTGTPTPGSGYGPGAGDGAGSNNPWTTDDPTPGSGYGPGPGDGSGSGSGSESGGGTGSTGSTGGGTSDGGGAGSGGGGMGGSGAGGGPGGRH